MKLLVVGSAPETVQLARCMVMSGSGSLVHCSDEVEALKAFDSGADFDLVLAEVDSAPTLEQDMCPDGANVPEIVFLDWAGQKNVTGQTAAAPGGLVREGEASWVLEYHVPRNRGSVA